MSKVKKMNKKKENIIAKASTAGVSTRHKPFVSSFAATTGVTLVSLVVTIVVLLILASISVETLFSEEGILKQSQEAKDRSSNSIGSEESKLNTVMDEYESSMQEPAVSGPTSIDVVPKLSDGMTPVKWNGTTWVTTTNDDPEWFDYANQEWANVVLGDATIDETTGIVDESKAYSMLVWIPRYAYKITSGWHQDSTQLASQGGVGTIEIVFLDVNNRDKNGTLYNKSYGVATANSTTTGAMSEYVVHPAFTYGINELEGFWVGKFESSNTQGVTGYDASYVLQIKPNVTSWRTIQVSDIYTVCTEMNKASNPYGLNTDDTVVDPHMLKNIEWGAVAYLSQSSYGKYGKDVEEIWNNSNSSYLTGQAGSEIDASNESSTNEYNTTNGVKASTTGTVYGVYDMSGGAYDYVAAYVNNSYIKDTTLEQYTYGENLIKANGRYKDVYIQGSDDTRPLNYDANSRKYGDAVYEVSSNGENNPAGWYGDYSNLVFSTSPFFVRGGYYGYTSGAGVFCFNYADVSANIYFGFRVTIPVL